MESLISCRDKVKGNTNAFLLLVDLSLESIFISIKAPLLFILDFIFFSQQSNSSKQMSDQNDKSHEYQEPIKQVRQLLLSKYFPPRNF